MTPEQVAETIQSELGSAVAEVAVSGSHPSVAIVADRWLEAARFLRDDPRLRLNFLRCLSGVDWLERNEIEAVYDLISMTPRAEGELWAGDNAIAIRVRVPRDGGHIPSVAGIWPAADWHERELFDMFGVVFDNHPDHRRILCPDDWVGYPLRKDYEHPLEYHGIPGTTEFGHKSPRH